VTISGHPRPAYISFNPMSIARAERHERRSRPPKVSHTLARQLARHALRDRSSSRSISSSLASRERRETVVARPVSGRQD